MRSRYINGEAGAQNGIELLYYEGDDRAQDYSQALPWFHMAAEQGNANGQYNLKMLYVNGTGVPQDFAEARRWYTLSAKQGFERAQTTPEDLPE